MIFYFTGTGNSKFIADALSDRLDDETVSLNDVFKNDLPKKFSSEKPFVITCPIYAWRIPSIVDGFLNDMELSGNRKLYIVATMESQAGRSRQYIEKTLAGKDIEFMGFRGIPMTNNCVTLSTMDDAATVEKTNERALKEVDEISEAIRNRGCIYETRKTALGGIKSGFINKWYCRHMSDPDFVVSDACIGCGKCEKLCPVNNITMSDGRPAFNHGCINCYSCIHHCPKAAIDIGRSTRNHGRFVCPEYVRRS